MEANATPRESREQALVRLAALANERGIQVFVYEHTGEWFATSSTRPGTLHRVTALSCDCAGFVRNQRCTHFAALLEAIGELPTIAPDPTPAPTMPSATIDRSESTTVTIECECCGGSGVDAVKDRNGDWRDVTCRACNGRGKADITVTIVDLEHYEHLDPTTVRGRQCGACHGEGFARMSTGGRLSDWIPVACAACQGSGLVPVLVRECDLVAA